MKARTVSNICVLLVLAIVSCSRQAPVEEPRGSIVISQISASYPSVAEINDDTKTVVSSVFYKFYWVAGDAIAIVNATKGRIDRYTVQAGSVGKVDGIFDADAEYTYDPSDVVYAVYPYVAASFEGGNLYVTLADEQYYNTRTDNTSFSRNDIQVASAMTGNDLDMIKEKNDPIVFERLSTMIRVSTHMSDDAMASEQISSLTINAEGLSGKAKVVFEGTTPSIANNSGNSDSITINITSSPLPTLSKISDVAQFISVLPASVKDGISFVFNTEKYEVGFYRKINSALESNTVLPFPFYEGAYTRVNSEELATSDKTWWVAPKTSDLSDESDAGTYRNSTLPGSGAGSYGEGAALADE